MTGHGMFCDSVVDWFGVSLPVVSCNNVIVTM